MILMRVKIMGSPHFPHKFIACFNIQLIHRPETQFLKLTSVVQGETVIMRKGTLEFCIEETALHTS